MNQDQNQIPNTPTGNPGGNVYKAPAARPAAARPAAGPAQRPVARPAQPAAARPAAPAQRPAQPAAARPAAPAQRPAQPAAARPAAPAQRPAQPAAARPAAPAQRPAQPAAARPAAPAQRPAQPAAARPAAPAQPAQPVAPQQPRKAAPAGKPHSKKKKRPVWVAPLIAGLSVIVLCAALYLGVNIAAKPYFAAGTGVSNNSYTASSADELVAYLNHPALMEGDTITLNGSFDVDIQESFGGYLSFPLVSFTGGSVNFTGGSCYIYGGYSETENFDGISFTGTDLVIDAPGSSLNWSAAPSDTSSISLKALNGADCRKELSVITPGRYVSLPVTVTNLSAEVLSGVEVKLSAPGLILVDGRSVTVDSLGVGESQSFNVTAICAEGGRHRVSATAMDEVGNPIVSGGSNYVAVMGAGYYAGDTHTHSVISNGDRENAVRFSSIEQNISSAYEAGMSYIISVEEHDYAKQLDQSAVDALVGTPGAFYQMVAAEMGQGYEHLELLNYPTDIEFPSDAYGEIVNQMEWTVQAAIAEAVNNGATVIYPHPTAAGDLLDQMYKMQNSYAVSAYEIMCRNHIYEDMSWTIAYRIWDMVNVQGRQKVFAVASSNNTTAEEVAMNYTKGYLGTLSDAGITDMIRSGNSFSSNGPDMRFDVGGYPMGSEMDVAEGESVVLNFTVSDDVPLTGVKVFKYTITGLVDDLAPQMLLDLDLTGQGLMSYSASLEDVVTDDCFYRVEVYSELANRYDQYSSVGRGYTNPIWVNVTGGDSGNTSISAMDYKAELTGIGFLDGICSAFVGGFEDVSLRYSDTGSRYIDATDGEFSLLGLDVATSGSTLALNFHKGAEGSADFVTVRVGAPNGSYTIEKIYIVR